jgi:hypothetical protein
MLSLLLGLFISSCQTSTLDFLLTPTERTEKQVTVPVRVDNCDGSLPKLQIYHDPYASKTVGVENLEANGGEPFNTIKKQIWRMYEKQPKKGITLLSVPAATKREYTIVVTRVINRGVVRGTLIDANKIRSQQEAIYYYPFAQNIAIDNYQDFSCP